MPQPLLESQHIDMARHLERRLDDPAVRGLVLAEFDLAVTGLVTVIERGKPITSGWRNRGIVTTLAKRGQMDSTTWYGWAAAAESTDQEALVRMYDAMGWPHETDGRG